MPLDIDLGRNFILTPSFGVNLYRGGSEDRGLGDSNPGAEGVGIRYSLSIDRIFGG